MTPDQCLFLVQLLSLQDERAIPRIDLLSNEDRVTLRTVAAECGITEFPRNLYFNYETQEWIGMEEVEA